MRVYTVHEPPESAGARLDRITFVKEGFCWPALFVPFFWLLWHRMWWALLGWMIVGVGLSVVGNLMPGSPASGALMSGVEAIITVISILFAFWFALEANAFRRWSLDQKGWAMLGVAAGRDREEAEQSFFRAHLTPNGGPASSQGRGVGARVAASRTPAHVPRVPNTPSSAANEPAFGLFPRPE